MADKIPATLQELKSTFPNSTADWRESQQEAGNDIAQASIAYAKHVEAKAAAEREEHAKQLEAVKTEAAKPKQSLGHQALTIQSVSDAGGIDSGDAAQDFNAAVLARLPRNRSASYSERQAAIAFVARTRPELHQAFVASGNQGSRVQRLIKEKYETASAN